MGENDPQGQGTGTGTDDSLGNDFLKNIPEVDRPVVEKYIKDWDSQVGKRFEKIHDDYKPYKSLGEVDELRAALEIRNMLDSDPTGSFKAMADALKQQGINLNELLGIETPTAPSTPPVKEEKKGELQGLPPELTTKLEQQEKLLKALADQYLAQQTQTQIADEERQLDEYMSGLKANHGEFDEDWVLLQMYKGVDGEKAVKDYQAKFGKPSVSAPPPLVGGGNIPSQTQSIAQMSDKERKELVANMLQAATRNGQ